MKKQKLLIATDCYLPRWDGIARFLLEAISDLEEKYEITLIAPDFEGEKDENSNIKTIRIPVSNVKIGDFQLAKKNKNIIQSHIEQADIVWTHTLSTIGTTAINLAKKLKKFNLFTIHSIDWELASKNITKNKFFQEILKKVVKSHALKYYKRCDLIMSPSTNVDNLLEWNNILTPKIRIKLGVNLTEFKIPESKEKSKENIRIDSESIVIGYCGRLSFEKNIETLLSVFRRLEKDFENLKLLVIGDGIKHYKDEMNKSENIIYLGPQNNVSKYLQAMDIFVLPSFIETTSLSTLEAMASKAVPVCTPVGELKEYIKDKVNGLVFPIQNTSILYLKLKWLIENAKISEELALAARLTIQEKFNWINTSEKIKEILDSIEIEK